MSTVVIIAHNIRSCFNVGSLLRTADGLGVETVYLTGYTPYPLQAKDTRLPFVAEKNHKSIAKTALGAEHYQHWRHHEDIDSLLSELQNAGYQLCALEQSPSSQSLPLYKPAPKVAILLGEEVAGIDAQLLLRCPIHLEIPMVGKKESFNVVEAATMAMYRCRFANANKQ